MIVDRERYRQYMEFAITACEAINGMRDTLPKGFKDNRLQEALALLEAVQKDVTKMYLEEA